MEFYNNSNLVIFTVEKIETYLKNGEEKKKFVGISSGWQSITRENMQDYVKEDYKAIGVLTGKKSNITVVDFDNVESYEAIIKTYPELKKCMKVKTRRGYHLYFNYDERPTTNTNVFKNYPDVDVRNDGGFIIGPKSSYKTLDGQKHKYKYIEGDLIDFPEYLIQEIKPEKIKQEIKPEQKNKPQKDTSVNEIEKLLKLLDDKRAEDFTEWRNVGFIINNELGEDGFTLFDAFSQRSSKYNKAEVFKFYRNIKKKDSGLKLGTLKKMAKEDSPELYKEEVNKKDPYIIMKKVFEDTHFKIINPVGFGCIYNGNLVIKTKKEMMDTYENMIYDVERSDGENVKIEKVKFINMWFADPEMLTYDRLDFKPCQQVTNNIYNTFEGFAVQHKESAQMDFTKTKLYDHMFNLCGRADNSFDWFLNCLTNIVKQPYKLTTTSLILRSVQGCGKDTFFNYFGNKILGSQYYANDSKTELFFGRFNSMIERKLLVVINETTQAATKEIINGLKDAVTKPVNKIEHKGKAPREEQNNIFYVFLSNNKNPLPIEETDRRFCAMECNNDIATNTEYFKSLYEELDSGKIDRAFYDFLMSRDINNIDFSKTRPITELYKNMKQRNTPPLARFLCEQVEKNINSYSGMTLFNLFHSFLNENQIDFKVSNTSFGIDMKDYKGIEKGRTPKGIEYKVDRKVLKEFLIKKGFYEELPEFQD